MNHIRPQVEICVFMPRDFNRLNFVHRAGSRHGGKCMRAYLGVIFPARGIRLSR